MPKFKVGDDCRRKADRGFAGGSNDFALIKSVSDDEYEALYRNGRQLTVNATSFENYFELNIPTPIDDEVIWEIRINEGSDIHVVKGAANVAQFVKGVRAGLPNAILERRVWERF